VSLALRAVQLHLPGPARRAALRELFAVTADAFGSPAPALAGLGEDELLRRYARFTAGQAEAAIRDGRDLAALQRRLEAAARALGTGLRARLRLATTQDAMDAARVAYRLLGIDFAGTAAGQVTIRRCFFSDLYSVQVCRLAGALDAGLLAGLSGGGRLEFSQRITESAPCCLAQLGPGTGPGTEPGTEPGRGSG
jgi:hypothetical protein